MKKTLLRAFVVAASFVFAATTFWSATNAAFAEDWGAPESFAVVNPAVRSSLSDVVSLSGDWEFALDAPNFRLGIGEPGWGSRTFDWSNARKIQIPGAWETQGVGEPGPCKTWDCVWDCGAWNLKHVYTGRALYRKKVEIPERWAGKRIWLKVGGVRSEAYLWVNGARAAFVDAYCGARKFDITRWVKPGETSEIVAQVRNDVPSRVGLLAVNHLFGGFYRDVELEATPNLYVDDVWIRGDVEKKTAKVRVYAKNIDETETPRVAFPNLEIQIKTVDGEIVGHGRAEAKDAAVADLGSSSIPEYVEVEIPIANCELWTPENPTLYLADVVLKNADGVAITGWTERFGVRDLKVVGRQFYLNGKPYFFRGAGDHNYDQINLFEPADRERFKEHMSIYKEAGFNYARFHTHCPFPEYFEAADEKGILLQPELPYYHDVPTEGFDFNPKRELNELFRTNRRYVSFATYSFGNEGFLGNPIAQEMYRWVKKFDPDRLVVHQDGGTNRPDNSDFTNSGVGAHWNSIINPWTPGDYDDVDRPFVAHEYLNLAIKMDPRYEPRFTGIRQAPVSVARWEKSLADVGLDSDWGAACIAASERLQGIYQKRGLESARLDPACDGYLFWSLVDASIPQGDCVAAQGYLNPFWEPRPNGVAPRDFYRFNGPSALLLKTNLDAPILVVGQNFDAEFHVSHFDAAPIPAGTLDWKLVSKTNSEKIVASGAVPFDEIAPGTAGILATAAIEIPENAVEKPDALEFVLSIRGTKIENSWNYWLFPRRERRSLDGFAVSDVWFDAFSKIFNDVERIPDNFDADADGDAETSIPNDGKIWIVAPDEEAFAIGIAAGRKIFALSPAADAPNVSLGWWALGTQIGTAFADAPAFGDFPNSPEMDELWFRLIRVGAPDMREKPFFGTFEPLAIGEGRDSYYLYLAQTKVGTAKILGAFALDLTQETPEAAALLDALLEYVASPKFDPKKEAASQKFDATEVPPGVVWGFGRVANGKTAERSVWKSLYSEATTMIVCRQDGLEKRLEWTTAPLDAATNENDDDSTTFMFVGGLGYWSEKKTDGFELSVDGASVLTFDLPSDEATPVGAQIEWRSSDENATLSFEVGRVVSPGPDFFGVFRLTIKNSLLDKNAKQTTLAVRSLGKDSRRWFSLNDYRGIPIEKTSK